MVSDSLTRFSNRVSNYAKYRPGYPAEIASLFGLRKGARVADIGSGTGLLSGVFLRAGCSVTGVEPNKDMREAGETLLAGFDGFTSIDGRAEATGLPEASFDLAMAGQAFHWFEPAATRLEWRRILKPGCFAALVWNDRASGTAFMSDVEDLVRVFAVEGDGDRTIRALGQSHMGAFFAPNPIASARFTHSQTFDFAGLRGRLLSGSYLPPEEESEQFTFALKTLFDKHQEKGQVSFDYTTHVYWGEL